MFFTRRVFLILLLILSACGAPERFVPDAEFDKVKNTKAIPTLENYSWWSQEWDRRGWILALKKNNETIHLSNAVLKNKIIYSFQKQLNLSASQFSQVSPLLFDSFWVDINALNPKIKQDENSLYFKPLHGFAFIKFKSPVSVWSEIYKQLGVPQLAQPEYRFVHDTWTSLEKIPEVDWAEPNFYNRTFQDTNTDLPTELQSSADKLEEFTRINAVAAMRRTKALPVAAVNVAVIDTGVDYGHADLKDQMYVNDAEKNGKAGVDDDGNGYVDDIYGEDVSYGQFETSSCIDIHQRLGIADVQPGPADLGGPGKACEDLGKDPSTGKGYNSQCGHGTHVAGIIAGKSNNSSAGIGLCQSCRILSVRTASRECLPSGKEYDGPLEDIAQIRAFQYILNFTEVALRSQKPIHIVNMSIGKYIRSRNLAYLTGLMSYNGIQVVAAAANEDTDTPSYPSAFKNVISVCALSSDSNRGKYAKAGYSNFGEWVDICAPGSAINSSTPGGNFAPESGTSQAAPYVASAIGFLLSINTTAAYTPAVAGQAVITYANSTLVYNDKKNGYYRGQYPDGTTYYLLGTGILDVDRAYTQTGATNDVIYDRENVNIYLKRGCIASHIGAEQAPLWDTFTSMPFLLLQFLLVWRLKRKFA